MHPYKPPTPPQGKKKEEKVFYLYKPFHFSKSSPFLDSSSLGGGIFGPSSETKVSPNASPPFLSVTSSVTMVRQTLSYTSSSSRITPTLLFLARQLWNNPMIYNFAE